MKKQTKTGPPRKLFGSITFIIVTLLIIYTTIASATLNANLQISGETVFMPNIGFTKEFQFVSSCEEYVIPRNGIYKLETWGASGGNSSSGMAGKGGYSTGTLTLYQGTKVYACVGGQGLSGAVSTGNQILVGGFNGGGNAWGFSDGNNGSGGGATDIRIGTNSLYARVIVAGGGGGSVSAGSGPQIGHGGGPSGLAGITSFSGGCTANGGTQTAGGTGSNCGNSFTPGQMSTTYNALFGQGGSGRKAGITENRAGGGGGWYGGGSTFVIGGGGSGFVWVNGASVPAGYMLTNNHYLSDTQNINGADLIPTHDGSGTMNGNSGNGFAKITCLKGVIDNVQFYLNGTADMQINVNGIYNEQGATLIINSVNYSSSVAVTGTVSTGTAGVYTKTYTYTYNGADYKLIRRVLVQNATAYTGTFNYTGAQQTINAPYSGWYKLEVWGAQGGAGTGTNSAGGNGGYATGITWLNAGTTLYIYVGQQGITRSSGDFASGGFNGGGHGGQPYTGLCTSYYGGAGGGATDIRIDGSGLYNRLIVAGGGGGGSGLDNTPGGAGGGTSGIDGSGTGKGSPGTQSSGGAAGTDGLLQNRTSYAGVFGEGGSSSLNTGAGLSSGVRSGGGGGSGWYGGGAGSNRTGNCVSSGSGGGAGGGGSSFIWQNGASIPTGYNISSNYHMGAINTTANYRAGNGMATITYLEL